MRKIYLLVALFMVQMATVFAQEELFPMIYAGQDENGKWGYVSEEDEWIIPPIYDAVMYESNGGMYGVSKNGKWGLVGQKNEKLLNVIYDEVYYEIDYTELRYLALFGAARKGDKWAFVTIQGAFVTPVKYDEIIMHFGKYEFVVRDENGVPRKGYIDKLGNEYWYR